MTSASPIACYNHAVQEELAYQMSDQPDGAKASITRLYNQVAPRYGRVGPDPFAMAGERLVRRVGIVEGSRVLDVAVGRGANLFPAAERVGHMGRVVGIDLAETMLLETAADIQRRALPQANVMRMDAERLEFEAESFDVVLCGFALFLFPHLDQALSEFSRVLRDGGALGITLGHHTDALSHWYGERLTDLAERYQFPLNASGRVADLSTLPTQLARAGFVAVRELYEPMNVVYADAQQWWDAKWTHGTRYSLEHMPPSVLWQFKAEVFARLRDERQPDGIHEAWALRFILATRGKSAGSSATS